MCGYEVGDPGADEVNQQIIQNDTKHLILRSKMHAFCEKSQITSKISDILFMKFYGKLALMNAECNDDVNDQR